MSRLRGEIKRKVADVTQPIPLNHGFQHLSLILSLGKRFAHFPQFVRCEVIDAVKVTGAESQGGNPHRQRFSRYRHETRQVALAVADKENLDTVACLFWKF